MATPLLSLREFLNVVPVLGTGLANFEPTGSSLSPLSSGTGAERHELITAAAALPSLRAKELPGEPVVIESIKLLRNGRQWLVHVRSTEGAEGLTVAHGGVLAQTYPIFLERVAPPAIGTDARCWEDTLREIYLGRGGFGSSYKWQGLAFWAPVASLEMAVLDLLGKAAGKPVTDLLGEGTLRREIGIYLASSNRGNTPETEVEGLRKFIGEFGARAAKYRLGARMQQTPQSDARDRALIPLMRESFPDITLYADANGSYDHASSLRFGKMLAETAHSFFEEPVPFDHYDETKAVREALEGGIIVAGGEQEISLRHFLWQIEHRIIDLPQPDIFYFGGLTRSIKVARAAHALGMTCTPHISGYGLGFLYAAVFAACTADPGPYQEYKGFDRDLPAEAPTGRLKANDGVVEVPTSSGFGVELDPDWVAAAQTIGHLRRT